MREYEVTVIFQANLEEEARNDLVARVTDWLTHGETEADKPVANVWGRRRLAYPIRKQNEGFYILFDAQLDPMRITDIERNLQYMEPVLRYMVVRKEQ